MDNNVYEVVGDIDIPSPQNLGCQDLLRDPQVACSGWLRKKRKLIKFPGRWPMWYVVLCGGCCYYYRNEYGLKPTGSFSLYGYNEVKRAKDVDQKQGLWPFRISHLFKEFKTYYFCASSEQEMKEWMEHAKSQMLLANKRNLPSLPDRRPADGAACDTSGDSSGSFEVYASRDKLRIQIPEGDKYKVKRQSEVSDDEDELKYRPPLPLPREPIEPVSVGLRRGPDGASVKRKPFVEAEPEPESDEDEEMDPEIYWRSIFFYGTKEEAKDIIDRIEEDGVYLVRDGDQGKVLQVYFSPRTRKYRIVEEKGQFSLPLGGVKKSFPTIEDLVFHYCAEPLTIDGKQMCLSKPYQLVPGFKK